MALTTTQVNQAFLATLGRPAEGSAATWGSTSLSLDSLLNSIFIAENTEDFVESLYTELLGRASDAEGKAFWNSLLATTSKEAVLAQFKAAVIAAGQADPSNADYQSFIAQNKAFVATLYANLLGRDDAKTADAEGIDFWANALATGMSRGDLISAFVSAALSDPNSDDAQTLNAKLSVADAYSAAFKDFGKDVTADEKKAAYAQLVEQMKEVVAGSTVEEFQDAINQFKGQNQDRKTDVFTKGEDDLDASESTAATTFRGTINISDSEKSTIESGDTATGNSEYAAANTLIVDVKSDGKEKDFTYSTEMAGVKINNVDNLTINNGTADVTLNLDGNNADFGGKVAITGKGDKADVTVAQNVASLNVSTSGAKKAYTDVTVNSGNTLGAFEGSAAKDTLTISGNIAKSINTGDGADSVTLGATAKVYEKATISLGGGDDTLTINTSDIGNYNADGEITENLKASVTIDGGAGTKDKLILQSDISAGVKAITGVETIKAENGTLGTLTAAISSAVADGLKTSVEGILTVKADYTNTKTIDLRGIKAVKDNDKKDLGSLSLSGITYENITLSSNISENIVVAAHKADSKKSYAEINKFAADDRISVDALAAKAISTSNKNLDLTNYNDVKTLLSGETGAVAINDAAGKKSYIWQVEVDGLVAPKLVAIVDKKLTVDGTSFVYDDGTAPQPPVGPVVPGQPTGELKAQKVANTDLYELSVVNPPLSVSKGGTALKLADDLQTLAQAATAKQITVNANGDGNISFDTAVKSSNQVLKVILQGEGTRTVDAGNISAKAVKFITDDAANTTLDISSKTFGASSNDDVFANDLKINLGAGTDVVNIGNQTYASGAFTLTGVEGIKASGGTLDADLVTKVASGAVTTDLTQIEGSLTLQKFAAATTSIDLSNIKTAVTNETALTIDIVAGTAVSGDTLTSVIGTAAKDTLVVKTAAGGGEDYSKTTLESIEGIELTAASSGDKAVLAAAQLHDKDIVLSATTNAQGVLSLKAAAADTTLDFSKLTVKSGNAIESINITDVAAGATVTLSKAAASIKEAVVLTGAATVKDVAASDSVSVAFDKVAKEITGASKNFAELPTTNGISKASTNAFFIAADSSVTDAATAKALILTKSFTGTVTDAATGVIAVNGANNSAYYYSFTINGPGHTKIQDGELTLIGTTSGNVIDNSDKFEAGVITFA